MQRAQAAFASAIPVPQIDIDEPVAVIPVASAAPLDGPPDGERINTFALAPAGNASPRASVRSSAMRDRIIRNPLAALAAAFSVGFLVARALR